MSIYSAEQLVGFQAFGERTRVVRGRRVYEPAAGATVVRNLMRLGSVESKEKVNHVLKSIGLSRATAALFLSRREVVRAPYEQGGHLEVRPVVPGVTYDNLSTYAASDGGYDVDLALGRSAVKDATEKKYKLNSLFRDVTLTDKLQISPQRMQAAKRLALQDAAGAAATLTEYIQHHGFPNSVVTAGDYAKTSRNAVEFIRSMGRTIVYPDLGAPSLVQAGHLEMSYDQFQVNDVLWTVRGPLKYANEVQIVYQLAIVYGPEHVLFMLGMETLMLGINIRNAKTGDYYNGALYGYSSMEGIQPLGYSFPSELSSEQKSRLFLAGKKLSPVYVDDVVVGSAVHVTDKQAIMNEHTMAMAMRNDAVPVLCGDVIESTVSVGGDVCAVRRDGVHAQWVLREPVVGERVVLCYSVGATVEYTEVLQVLAYDDQLVLSESNVLRQGASGAAVVALRDSALLGIFSTKRASRVYCAPFTSMGFAVVTDCQSVASQSQATPTPAEGPGDHTYALMVKRGLLGYLEHVSASVATLYRAEPGGMQVAGLVANVDGEWHTTVDPNRMQLTMEDGRMLTFRTTSLGTRVVESPPPVLQAVPNVRNATPGERVFAFTKVGQDTVMSSVRMVTHCYADGKGFVVEDFGDSGENLSGAVVIAERDAAIVGMYAERVVDLFGTQSVRCVPLAGSLVSAGLPDIRKVHSDLTMHAIVSDTAFSDYVAYGLAVWKVCIGRKAHMSGVSLPSAMGACHSLWLHKYPTIMMETGGVGFVEMHVSDDRNRDALALAYLAALYMREDIYVSEVVSTVLEGVFATATPVVGEFPFPRASSAASSGRSRSTHSRKSSSNINNERLLELEERVKRLAEAVGGT